MSKVPENRTNCFKMMSIGTALMALDREKGQISISTSDESLQQPPVTANATPLCQPCSYIC